MSLPMSKLHITTRDHGNSLVLATAGDHVDAQGLRRTGPVPYWLWQSGEVAPPLTSESSAESRPCAAAGQRIGAGSGNRGAGAGTGVPALRMRAQECQQCHSTARRLRRHRSDALSPPLLPPSRVKRANHEVIRAALWKEGLAPGQHRYAVQRRAKESWPQHLFNMRWLGCRDDALTPSLSMIIGRAGLKVIRAGEQGGEQAMHLAWAT